LRVLFPPSNAPSVSAAARGAAMNAAIDSLAASTDPDFADDDVVQRDRVVAFDYHRSRFGAGFERIELGGPLAIGAGFSGVLLLGESDSDLLAWLGPAPDGCFHIALNNHVVADDGGEFDVGVGEGGHAERDGEHEQGGWNPFHLRSSWG